MRTSLAWCCWPLCLASVGLALSAERRVDPTIAASVEAPEDVALPTVPRYRSSLRAWSGPTGQPASRAQDLQECGYLLLPAKVQLIARPPGLLHRSGLWQSLDSATLATWDQFLLRWSPDNVYYRRGSLQLFKAVRPSSEPLFAGRQGPEEVADVVLEDCVGAPLYTFRALEQNQYELLDRGGRLLARSRFGTSDFYPKQMLFTDPEGAPIAVAESPIIAHPPSIQGRAEPLGSASPPWQLFFYNAETTNSTLVQAQNRWVVAAIVQDHVLRLAAQGGTAPDLRAVFAALLSGAVILVLVLVALACRSIGLVVHPPPEEEVPNPYFRDPIAYGALGPKVWYKRQSAAAR